MLDVFHIRVRPLPLWLLLACGALAGLGAALLLAVVSLPLAVLAIGAVAAGALVFSAPELGLYLLTAAMIAQWPGRLITVAGAALSGCILLWALSTRHRLIPLDRIFLLLAVLTALVWCSALAQAADDATRVALTFTSFLVLYWMVSTLSVRAAVVERMAGAMLLAGVATALIGFVQYLHPFVWIASAQFYEASSIVNLGSSLSLLQWEGINRIESVTGTPNYLGLSMQILLPFALFWMFQQTTAVRRVAGAAAVAALVGALVLSFTRGVMLTTAAVTLPLLVVKLGWRRTLPYLLASAAMVLVAVIAWAPLRARVFSTVVEVVSADPATAAGWRVAATPIGLRMFLDHFWTGVGIGQQRLLWSHYAPTYIFTPGTETQLPIHNAYLAIAIDLGVAGLGLLLGLLGLAWWRLRWLQTAFAAPQQRGLRDLAAAAEVALVSYGVSMFMYPGVENFRYFWVLLAAIGALSRIASDQQAAQGMRHDA